jgi:flagellar L-ring protein FlgH
MSSQKLILVLVTILLALWGSARADNLFNPDQYRAVAADKKAYKVGDNLTVQVFENASATTTAGTNTEKTNNAKFAFQDTASNSNSSIGVNATDDFQGKGQIQRSGKLLAQITVTVKSIDSAGLLYVSGEQLIAVNDEKQEIKLEGKVRPSDVGENNTVGSSRLSDAKISYIGEGVLGDRQRPGLIRRFFSWLGLL